MTHPISPHRLALPGQSRRKKEEVVELEKRKETTMYSTVGCLYPPSEIFLTQKEEKMTDFCVNINAKQ